MDKLLDLVDRYTSSAINLSKHSKKNPIDKAQRDADSAVMSECYLKLRILANSIDERNKEPTPDEIKERE